MVMNNSNDDLMLNPTSVKTRLQVQIRQHPQNTPDQEKQAIIESAPKRQVQYDGILNCIREIIHEEGILGLYGGLGSSILGTASMNFAYFYWSTAARGFQVSTFKRYGLSNANSISKELLLGAVGGALAQLCTNPIAVISTRQQTRKVDEPKRSIWETMLDIIRSDGWTGLWRGLKVNLILVINPMITYGVYQWLREALLVLRNGKGLGSFDAFGTIVSDIPGHFADLFARLSSIGGFIKSSSDHHHTSVDCR